MSITYEEALSTLNSMFGPPWTSDHLDAVLRHHQGHMENTVESVLNHGDADPNVLIQQLKDGTAPSPGSGSGGGAGAGGTEHTVNVDEELARQLADEEQQQRGNRRTTTTRTTTRRVPAPAQQPHQQRTQRPAPPSPVPPSSPAPSPPAPPTPTNKKGRGTPTSLPEDFLRVPGRTPSAQEDADEQLARMLQDELFAKELKNNPEFAHLARGRSSRGGRGTSSPGRAMAGHGYGRSAAGYPGASRGEGHDNRMAEVGQELVDGISKLGIAAKSRLQSLAANFNAQMQGGAGHGGANATGTAAGGGSHRERRGLLDGEDEDEEEVSFLRGSGAVGVGGGPRGTDVEMRPVGSTSGSSGGGSGGGGFLSGWGGGGGDGKKKD